MARTMAPFPWLPMMAISAGLISHSYSLTSLFPYVGYMVQHMGVTEDKDASGFYAGFIASAFMVGRFSSSYFWGRFSDHYGRLPVFYVGLWTIAIMSIGFGMSTNIYWALACRFFLGAFNGIVATSKTMISEVCSSEHEVVGMSFVTADPSRLAELSPPASVTTKISLPPNLQHNPDALPSATWSIGFIIGPGLGGILAEPATHYPSFFHEAGIFGRFPYLLPNLVGAGLALVSLPLTYLFLDETHPAHANAARRITRSGFKLLSLSEVDSNSVDAAEMGRLEAGSLERYNSVGDSVSFSSETLAAFKETIPKPMSKVGKGSEASIGSASNTSVTFATEVTSISDDGDHNEKDNDNSDNDSDDLDKSTTVHSYFVVDDDSDEGTTESTDESLDAHDTRCSRVDTEIPADRTSGNKPSTGTRKTESLVEAAALGFRRECLSPALMLAEKRVRVLMIVYGVYSFINIGFQEVYPLWALSTVAKGGLDWTTKDIGQVLSLVGVMMMVFQTCIYPILLKKMGTRRLQRWASILATPLYVTVPTLAYLRGNKCALVVATILVVFMANSCGNTIFVTVAVATNNAVKPERRGELNGLAMMVGSLAKAMGPFFFSVVFAWSISTSRPFPLGPHLVYLIVSLGMFLVATIGWNIISDEEERASRGETGETEEGKTELIRV